MLKGGLVLIWELDMNLEPTLIPSQKPRFRTKIGQTVTKFELNLTQKPMLKNKTPGFK